MELLDYRDLPEDEPFDKIASIGMFEHVGRAKLPALLRQDPRLLVPGGLLMNHGITAGGTRNDQLGAGMGDFIERYIFPGGELLHVSQVLREMSRRGAGAGRRREPAAPLRAHAVGLVRCARGTPRAGAGTHRASACCAPTASTWRAARWVSSRAGCRSTRCSPRGPAAGRGRPDARGTIRLIPSTASYMYR